MKLSDVIITDELRARFWDKVNVRSEEECWEWKTPGTPDKYPAFSIGGRTHGRRFQSHHIAWLLSGHLLPDGLQLLHKCDNRRCVNSAHLFEGTQLDNMRDMDAKGRRVNAQPRGDAHPMCRASDEVRMRLAQYLLDHPEKRPRGDQTGSRRHPESRPRGTTHPMVKLTEEQVLRIRELGKTMRYRDIAKMVGSTFSTVQAICSRRLWRHLP